MRTFTKTALVALLSMSVLSISASADADKGKKLYQKNLKESCGFTGAVFAAKFKQADWEKAYKAGTLNKKMIEACPAGKEFIESDKFKKVEEHLYDFVHTNAKDSGNIPNC
ncbi:MAG: cytochrome C [Sulfuricurvum sp.]|uniref:cytochrome C n=1 Tax=Sulfuricurvum sp. TaxID=2025608 RepID=UPI00263009B4|nr:cytochrome C [Sulfuricurvum sp.]MDD5159115.1 cytochrome C [Sulfuricurvum sp.]